MGIFVLWVTWAHEYMDVFVKNYGHRTEFSMVQFSCNQTKY